MGVENLYLVFCLVAVEVDYWNWALWNCLSLDHKYTYQYCIEYVFMLTLVNMMEMSKSIVMGIVHIIVTA